MGLPQSSSLCRPRCLPLCLTVFSIHFSVVLIYSASFSSTSGKCLQLGPGCVSLWQSHRREWLSAPSRLLCPPLNSDIPSFPTLSSSCFNGTVGKGLTMESSPENGHHPAWLCDLEQVSVLCSGALNVFVKLMVSVLYRSVAVTPMGHRNDG